MNTDGSAPRARLVAVIVPKGASAEIQVPLSTWIGPAPAAKIGQGIVASLVCRIAASGFTGAFILCESAVIDLAEICSIRIMVEGEIPGLDWVLSVGDAA